jgi:protein-tyrosine-phosphatase
MNILFVCSANVSRSFLAEVLLKKELESLGIEGIGVSSAGLYAYPGNPPDPQMVDYILKAGIAYEPHESKEMTVEDAEWADLILVMEKDHFRAIKSAWPEAGRKTELLSRYVYGDWAEDDIIDSYGKPDYHYRLAQSQISLAIKNLSRRILQNAQNQDHSR